MAKVFLDTNAFIDFIEERLQFDPLQLSGHLLFISPLSIHIISYLYKYHIPESKLENIHDIYTLVPFNQTVTMNALKGPTVDFEDNVQLHSAAEAECDLFLTNDGKLLNLTFFGKMRIVPKP